MKSTPTLKDLIRQTVWLSVSSVLVDLYPEEKNNLQEYDHVFHRLKLMEPEDIQMILVLKNVGEGDDHYVDVSGKHKYPKTEEEKYLQAIEFCPWRQWLGMEIDPESLREFSQLEIIAHCLYEMTFINFEEEKIQEELDSIKNSVEEYKSMTEEEKRENTRSLDDLLKDLDDADTETDENSDFEK